MSHDHPEESVEERAARRRQFAPGAVNGIDEALIEAVVRGFYGRICNDARLGPIFANEIGHDWEPHLRKMMDFWSSLLLLTGRYGGRPMPVHVRLEDGRGGLQPADFQHWLALFQATLAELCTAEAQALFMERARRIADSFQMGIQFHRGQTPDWLGPVKSAAAKQ